MSREVPVRARELAAKLAALFESDCRIVERLNDAQRRLQRANDQLWSGLAPDAFGLIYDSTASAGHSQIAKLIEHATDRGGRGSLAVLEQLQAIHWAIHHAFCQYQSVCEERRQLAVDVGEIAQQLAEVLAAAGWAADAARSANVHELAGAGA